MNNNDAIRFAATAVGAIVSLPFAFALIKAGMLFGRWSKIADTAETFITTATGKLESLDRRVTSIEAERRAEAELFGRRHLVRRASDPSTTDEHSTGE